MDNLYLYEGGRYAPFVERGDLAALKDELNRNGDFREVAVDLLSVAVIEQKLDIVEWLLQQGVDPNDSDPYEKLSRYLTNAIGARFIRLSTTAT